ncbi:DUF1294 domain-containing protein [Enterococcus sp. HY326]|uniref:DUF1294 domain-containing protein n=1 Tax=Enterococcus sp. HY326 TaxID=2971265 RepID=UPI00223F1884|nr:DUF1294 domain-containing protein [Enterococcus sp. HY326]
MVVYGYLVSVNVLLFLLMGLDKQKARKHQWRVPEKTLLALGIIGAGFGGLIGQQVFHHKTRKPKFYAAFFIGVMVALVLIYMFDKSLGV